MPFLPVIAREMRSAARHPFTYYLRTLGVTALLLACLLFALDNGFAPNLGGKLFGNLHLALFWAIWVLVPMLTADCISRERREGTLGLLFLTQLKARDIVAAKGFTHGLRALSLWLAVLPVVTIPFLLGGVGRIEALLSVLVNWSAMCWALAAGLLASAWNRVWLRAMLQAATLAIVFLLMLGTAMGWILASVLSPAGMIRGRVISDYGLLTGLSFLTDTRWGWPNYVRLASATQLFWTMGVMTALSLVALLSAVLIAGAQTRRAWQEKPPSARALWWHRTLFTPVLWLSFFRRWMRRKLELNPIGWLEQRTWSGRLVSWAWLAVLISVYSTILTDRYFQRSSDHIQSILAWFLAGSMAMGAAGSFRRERETGVLELLLVSPLTESEIIFGRLRGLWGQFAPAVGMLLGIWSYFSTFLPQTGNPRGILFYGCTFLTVPVIGLFFSLQARNFISAFLSTLTIGLFLPLFLPAMLGWVWWLYHDTGLGFAWEFGPSLGGALCQLVFAALSWTRLYQRLKRRAFPLERTE